MNFDIITLFPGMFFGPLQDGVLARARRSGTIGVRLHDLRRWGVGPQRQVDDTPYGGGGGMVLKPEPLFAATEAGVWKHGHTSCAQHAGAWSPRQANARDFAGVVIHGNRGGSGQIAKWYGSRGIAAVMVDLPRES